MRKAYRHSISDLLHNKIYRITTFKSKNLYQAKSNEYKTDLRKLKTLTVSHGYCSINAGWWHDTILNIICYFWCHLAYYTDWHQIIHSFMYSIMNCWEGVE